MDAFEKLDVCKRSARLCTELYKVSKGCTDFGFRDQITRAALSVPSNIAEGYERNSRKEYIRFLKIAKGSCGELRTQLYVAIEAALLDREAAGRFLKETMALSRMLQALISSLAVGVE